MHKQRPLSSREAARREAQRDAAKLATKVGWRISEWTRDTGFSRAYVYLLLERGQIDSVKVGSMRIIRTSPSDYLNRLAIAAAAKTGLDASSIAE